MKKLCMLLALAVLWSFDAPAAIKNGYAVHISEVRESLKALRTILAEIDTLSIFQKTVVKRKIGSLLEYITYYELTEQLLSQFRLIAPDLYNRVDSVRSRNGETITVYVRFVPEGDMQHGAHATTNLARAANDPDLYTSEFGSGTVSIKIASVGRSLLLLAHELGHVFHQVRNLKTYTVFYSKLYQNGTFKSTYIGHDGGDPSGLTAIEFENTYRDRYGRWAKSNGEKIYNPFSLLATIRKHIGQNVF